MASDNVCGGSAVQAQAAVIVQFRLQADARANLEDVMSVVGPEFEVGEAAKEVDTLAGYIASRIGRVPVRGELVPGPGRFEIEVLDADPRRVKKLKIFVSTEQKDGRSRDTMQRVAPPGSPATASTLPSTQSVLPVNRDPSVKLSPDDPPSKAPRRP